MISDVLRQVIEELVPFHKFLGVKVDHVERGHIRLVVPFREELIGNPVRRVLHGGVISMLADAAGGFVIASALEGGKQIVGTIDLRIDYLRPGRTEALMAEAFVVRIGGQVGVADIRLFHGSAESATIATGKGVYAIRSPKSSRTSGVLG